MWNVQTVKKARLSVRVRDGDKQVGGMVNMPTCHLDIENPDCRTAVHEAWNSPTIFDHTGPLAVGMFRACAALSDLGKRFNRDFDISGLADLSGTECDVLEPVRWPVPKQVLRADVSLLSAGSITPTARRVCWRSRPLRV